MYYIKQNAMTLKILVFFFRPVGIIRIFIEPLKSCTINKRLFPPLFSVHFQWRFRRKSVSIHKYSPEYITKAQQENREHVEFRAPVLIQPSDDELIFSFFFFSYLIS